ncbi:16476_t:CDS:2 [Dentiscutata erythropus]|uniref:16476_t:CDS:1 n=1 Tax=Dentiscutata erythropus TaxID=1348616 RepID=A0A9N9AAG8_9GLOM|nr:16476_t:CDS:2 [Dentiscutata erythropus]
METEYENRYEAEEMKKNNKPQKERDDVENKYKIDELLAQMKLSKLQAGKELVNTCMKAVTLIIDQNSNVFRTSQDLLNQLKDEKLPKSTKTTIINKVLQDYMNTRELLDYAKKQINELQLKQENEFTKFIGFAVDQDIFSEYIEYTTSS